jgi:hypothetical protein
MIDQIIHFLDFTEQALESSAALRFCTITLPLLIFSIIVSFWLCTLEIRSKMQNARLRILEEYFYNAIEREKKRLNDEYSELLKEKANKEGKND